MNTTNQNKSASIRYFVELYKKNEAIATIIVVSEKDYDDMCDVCGFSDFANQTDEVVSIDEATKKLNAYNGIVEKVMIVIPAMPKTETNYDNIDKYIRKVEVQPFLNVLNKMCPGTFNEMYNHSTPKGRFLFAIDSLDRSCFEN